MKQLQTSDPYENGLDYITKNLMVRKRYESKEVAKENFKANFRPSSSMDAHCQQAKKGSIRHAKNMEARKRLSQYNDCEDSFLNDYNSKLNIQTHNKGH